MRAARRLARRSSRSSRVSFLFDSLSRRRSFTFTDGVLSDRRLSGLEDRFFDLRLRRLRSSSEELLELLLLLLLLLELLLDEEDGERRRLRLRSDRRDLPRCLLLPLDFFLSPSRSSPRRLLFRSRSPPSSLSRRSGDAMFTARSSLPAQYPPIFYHFSRPRFLPLLSCFTLSESDVVAGRGRGLP